MAECLREESLAEYVINGVRLPLKEDFDQDVEWICKSLGFLETRDKEKTAARIFKVLLEAAGQGKGLSSDELAEKIGLTRGTMVHHLNKMIKSGIIIRHEGQYKLRCLSLRKTVEEIERDVDRIVENMVKIAQSIDNSLGLSYR